ncbi:hypothetical protein FD09_GL001078 [Schleiferilactobacillus perolens DSM 12744]|jgi:hypothetical protein|uniref:Uncharacterized protein n=2 Tax=Schleiferilactobacillus perolens TaxID=100468 RepID=A0A0R1MNP7_9LACO|nr:hypothetical protein FD09_GL001078 [Schleiferilactobacillus perolens DSM 12744]
MEGFIMPLLAILIDVITLGVYFLTLNSGATRMGIFPLAVQIIATIVLLLMTIAYQGRRRVRYHVSDDSGYYRPFTFRFAIVVGSLLVNGVVAFLYWLSFSGGNNLIMQFYG